MAHSKPNATRPCSGNESPSFLDEVVHMNDGSKHDGMATLVSQFHLLTISAFTLFESLPHLLFEVLS